jgi:hypothetical protein
MQHHAAHKQANATQRVHREVIRVILASPIIDPLTWVEARFLQQHCLPHDFHSHHTASDDQDFHASLFFSLALSSTRNDLSRFSMEFVKASIIK